MTVVVEVLALVSQEMQAVTIRNEIAKLVDQGKTTEQICKQLRVSSETVTRVRFFYNEHPHGYQAVFKFISESG